MDTNGKSDWLLGRRKKKLLLRSTIHDPRSAIRDPRSAIYNPISSAFLGNLCGESFLKESAPRAASPYRVVEEAAFFLLPQ
jgi:hypothetical protein